MTTKIDISQYVPGVTAYEILRLSDLANKDSVIACRVNGLQRPLSWKLNFDSELEFIDTYSREGIAVYTNTLIMLLTNAALRIKNYRLLLTQSVSDSYYFVNDDKEISESDMHEIEAEMRRMVAYGEPIERITMPLDEAVYIMEKQGYYDKALLAFYSGQDPHILYRCCGIYTFFGLALAHNASLVPNFALHLYEGGIFLSLPKFYGETTPVEFKVPPRLFNTIRDYTSWLKRMGVASVPQLHELTANGFSKDIIMACEARHTMELTQIARDILSRKDVRLLCMAGPSSSGKTTSSNRIRAQLHAAGIWSHTLELDNYFVDRKKTPKDEQGKPDFESLGAIDVELINEHIAALLAGKEVMVPKYDFITGKQTKGHPMRIEKDEMLVIEGIHGLNDELTYAIAPELKYKIFISPLAGINLDSQNRMGTHDLRLLRRLVRDARKRGYSAEATLKTWPSVVRGGYAHIFPYEVQADVIFNTSLAYELPVLNGYVTPLLRTVEKDSPVFGDATRLLSILDLMPVIPSDNVPNTSILREFIGGSCFE